MKHLQIYDNFISDFFKSKSIGKSTNPLYHYKFKTNDLVKRKKDGEIGRVFGISTPDNNFVYFVQFLDDIETYDISGNENWSVSYTEDELEEATEEEKEYYRNIKKYNL